MTTIFVSLSNRPGKSFMIFIASARRHISNSYGECPIKIMSTITNSWPRQESDTVKYNVIISLLRPRPNLG